MRQNEDSPVKSMAKRSKKRKYKRKKILINSLLVLIALIGLVFTFQMPITTWIVNHFQHKYSLRNLSKRDLEANKKRKVSFDTKNVKTVNFFDAALAQMDGKNYPVIGAIAYPDLSIVLPILNGDGDATMLYGAGTMKPNEVMGQGNYALASHHVSNVYGHSADGLLFSPLQNAKVGQEIYLTDKEKVYEYKTTSVESVTQDQGVVTADVPNKKLITLVTCAQDDTFRIVVRGELVQITKFNNATAQLFSSKYTQWWN